jgi:hypothetical protein
MSFSIAPQTFSITTFQRYEMKMHMVRETPKPPWWLFWRKQEAPTKTVCGRDLDGVPHTTEASAVTCKSCLKLLNKVK